MAPKNPTTKNPTTKNPTTKKPTPKSATRSTAKSSAATAVGKTPRARTSPAKRPSDAKPAAPGTDVNPVVVQESGAPAISAEERYKMIAHRAYLRAEQRGFAPGNEVEDWLQAESEVDRMLHRG